MQNVSDEEAYLTDFVFAAGNVVYLFSASALLSLRSITEASAALFADASLFAF